MQMLCSHDLFSHLNLWAPTVCWLRCEWGHLVSLGGDTVTFGHRWPSRGRQGEVAYLLARTVGSLASQTHALTTAPPCLPGHRALGATSQTAPTPGPCAACTHGGSHMSFFPEGDGVRGPHQGGQSRIGQMDRTPFSSSTSPKHLPLSKWTQAHIFCPAPISPCALTLDPGLLQNRLCKERQEELGCWQLRPVPINGDECYLNTSVIAHSLAVSASPRTPPLNIHALTLGLTAISSLGLPPLSLPARCLLSASRSWLPLGLESCVPSMPGKETVALGLGSLSAFSGPRREGIVLSGERTVTS